MSIDVDTVSDLIRDVGARVIDTRFRALHDHQIHQKKPGDFVTDADRQAEHELGAALMKYVGGVVVERNQPSPTRRSLRLFPMLTWPGSSTPLMAPRTSCAGLSITALCLLNSTGVKQSEDGFGSHNTDTCGSLSAALE